MKQLFYAGIAVCTAMVLNACSGPSNSGSAPTLPTNALSPNIKLINPGDLYVGSEDNTIAVYSTPANKWQPVLTIGKNVKYPSALAVNPLGDLFVANKYANRIGLYNSERGDFIRSIVVGVAEPIRLATDSSSDLAAVEAHTSNVTLYDSTGTFRKTITNLRLPQDVVFDKSGNIYVSNYLNDEVRVYAPMSNKVIRTIKDGIKLPGALAIDDKQTLFVANLGNDTVTAYGPTDTKPALTITDGVKFPVALATVRADKVYIANRDSDSVLDYDLKTNNATTITDGVDRPVALAIQPGGYLCVADIHGENVTIYAPDDTLVKTIKVTFPISLAIAR